MERISSIEGAIASVVEEVTTVVDWEAEAARIAASSAESNTESDGDGAAAGAVTPGAPTALSPTAPSPSPPGTIYSVKNLSLWVKATHEEKLRLILAFETNTVYSSVQMANCAINDALGAAWGRVLGSNTTSERAP